MPSTTSTAARAAAAATASATAAATHSCTARKAGARVAHKQREQRHIAGGQNDSPSCTRIATGHARPTVSSGAPGATITARSAVATIPPPPSWGVTVVASMSVVASAAISSSAPCPTTAAVASVTAITTAGIDQHQSVALRELERPAKRAHDLNLRCIGLAAYQAQVVETSVCSMLARCSVAAVLAIAAPRASPASVTARPRGTRAAQVALLTRPTRALDTDGKLDAWLAQTR
jgi:hypothetical protein